MLSLYGIDSVFIIQVSQLIDWCLTSSDYVSKYEQPIREVSVALFTKICKYNLNFFTYD